MSGTNGTSASELAVRKIKLTELPSDRQVAYLERLYRGENPDDVLRDAQSESTSFQGEKMGRGFPSYLEALAYDDVANGLLERRVATCHTGG